MRFRFCGDLDCPDWVLVQIQNLSKLTSVKLKLLVNEIISDIVSKEIKFDKVTSLTSAAKFDDDDVRATAAALDFILTTSSKYDVDGDTLSNELQQLGLPKEHAAAFSKVYAEKLEAMRKSLRSRSLRVNRFSSASWHIQKEVIGDGLKANIPIAVIDVTLENPNQTETISFTEKQLANVISELRQVVQIMK